MLIDLDITKCLFWQINNHLFYHFGETFFLPLREGPDLILIPGPGLALNGPEVSPTPLRPPALYVLVLT